MSDEAPQFDRGLSAAGLRFAIIVSRFNSFVTEKLLRGAVDALAGAGADASLIDVIHVPGAWELPLAVKTVAELRKHDGIVCLGAVIRGDTPHFDFVAGEAARGIAAASLDAGLPVAFGVLTTNTEEQAMDRAGGKSGNKGADAALTALEMVHLLRKLRGN